MPGIVLIHLCGVPSASEMFCHLLLATVFHLFYICFLFSVFFFQLLPFGVTTASIPTCSSHPLHVLLYIHEASQSRLSLPPLSRCLLTCPPPPLFEWQFPAAPDRGDHCYPVWTRHSFPYGPHDPSIPMGFQKKRFHLYLLSWLVKHFVTFFLKGAIKIKFIIIIIIKRWTTACYDRLKRSSKLVALKADVASEVQI